MILTVEKLKKSYGTNLVLDDITLEIDTPRLIALIAPNGSGKSTLMNIICNLEKADSGEIKLFDQTNQTHKIFHSISYLQDNRVLYEELTGWEHLELVANAHVLDINAIYEITDYLSMTGYLDKKVQNYSLGMKQHLLFAMAILPDPKLLILDEPLNGLDPASVRKVREYLNTKHREGKTIILSSHNLEQIDKLTEDILFLTDGKLVSYDEIVKDKRMTYKLVTENMTQLIESVELHSLAYTQLTDYKLALTSTKEDYEKLSIQLNQKKVRLLDVEIVDFSLEDLYLELFGDYEYENE